MGEGSTNSFSPTVPVKMSPGKQHKRVVWDIVGSSHLLHRNSGLSNLPGSLGSVVALQCLAFFSGGHSRCPCKLPLEMKDICYKKLKQIKHCQF